MSSRTSLVLNDMGFSLICKGCRTWSMQQTDVHQTDVLTLYTAMDMLNIYSYRELRKHIKYEHVEPVCIYSQRQGFIFLNLNSKSRKFSEAISESLLLNCHVFFSSRVDKKFFSIAVFRSVLYSWRQVRRTSVILNIWATRKKLGVFQQPWTDRADRGWMFLGWSESFLRLSV